jgi:Tol biopolymer transport system component
MTVLKFTEPRRLIRLPRQGAKTHVTFHSIAFSPNGQRIAFSLESQRGAAIGILNRDDGKLTKLAQGGLTKSGIPRDDTFWYLQFTPDGKHLLYTFAQTDEDSMYLTDTVTMEQRCLTEKGSYQIRRPKLSPDGQIIVFESWEKGTANLCQMSVRGGEVTALTHTCSPQANDREYNYLPGNIYPCYSPDGQWIVFVSSDYNGKVDNRLQVCIMRSDGTDVTRLTDFPDDCSHPLFHPNGRQIAFTTHAELESGIERKKWKYRLNLYLMNMDGSDLRRLEESNSVNRLGGFSPDGRYIVYQSSGEERFEEAKRNWDICLVDTKTGIVHKVTDNDLCDKDPIFSPDGRSILFVSERDGFVGLYQTDIIVDRESVN